MSQCIGLKNHAKALKFARQIIGYNVGLMLLVSVALFAGRNLLTQAFFTSERVRRLFESSMITLCLNMVPHTLFPVLSGLLRWGHWESSGE